MSKISVAVFGAGQLGNAVADRLADRADIEVRGPAAHDDVMLTGGADVVIIATTTRLAGVADDVRRAVDAGSNVIVSAEESSYPWAVDAQLAADIDAAAREKGVTVLGGGVNPGFIFDALVLTLLGTTTGANTISVRRTVDISRFGAVVLGRLGVGFDVADFEQGVAEGRILGHAGFPQSMAIVADALGLEIERIDRQIEPIVAETTTGPSHYPVAAGQTAGVRQIYTAIVEGTEWYTAAFTGHVDLDAASLSARDEIEIDADTEVRCTLAPGVGAQAGSSAMVANSVDRVLAAPPGWLTVADLEPAFPRLCTGRSGTRFRTPAGQEKRP